MNPLLPESMETMEKLERCVLGCVLYDPYEVAPFIVSELTPEDFHNRDNRTIFEAIQKLKETSDLLTLSTAVSGKLSVDYEEAYISELTVDVPSALNYRAYVLEVQQNSLLRKTIQTGTEIARLATDEMTSPDDIPAKAAAIVSQLKGKSKPVRKIGDVAGAVWERIEATYANPDAPYGITWTYKDFDMRAGKMEGGDFIIVAGRPGSGKSSLMLSMALRHAKQGIPVTFYPYEQGAEELTRRALVQETGFTYQEIKSVRRQDDNVWRNFDSEELNHVFKARAALDDLPLFFEEGMPTVDELASRVMRDKAMGVQVFYLDYIQLMKGAKKIENRVQELSYITRTIKELARKANVAIIAGSQLNRGVEERVDKRPMLSDLRESGSLEQDADGVIGLYRDEVYNPDSNEKNRCECHFLKNRNGDTITSTLHFDKRLMKFSDLALEKIEL